MRLVVDNTTDLDRAWQAYEGAAIELAAMFADPSRGSSAARLEQAKDTVQAEQRFRKLFLAECDRLAVERAGGPEAA